MGNTKPKKGIYYALISTFVALWLIVAFVSTLHAITFFQLTNTIGLAILLGLAFEIGQATVLFSILMTENKNKFLPWAMMLFLTALQVTANVYASFRFMDLSGTNEWVYWQRAILFSVQSDTPEMYKVIISWISGALLPLIALGMTSLVAENINIVKESKGHDKDETDPAEELKIRLTKEELDEIEKHILSKKPIGKVPSEVNMAGAGNVSGSEIPFVEGTSLVDIDKILHNTTNVPNKNGRSYHEAPISDEPPMEQEVNQVLPHYSDEELHEMFMDEYENLGKHFRDDEDGDDETEHLTEEAERLSYPIEPQAEPISEVEITPEPQVEITHKNGLIEVTSNPPEDPEEARLERLREIAREKLKKK